MLFASQFASRFTFASYRLIPSHSSRISSNLFRLNPPSYLSAPHNETVPKCLSDRERVKERFLALPVIIGSNRTIPKDRQLSLPKLVAAFVRLFSFVGSWFWVPVCRFLFVFHRIASSPMEIEDDRRKFQSINVHLPMLLWCMSMWGLQREARSVVAVGCWAISSRW